MEKKKISKIVLSSLIFILFMALFQINSNAATLGNIYFKAINSEDSNPISNLEVSIYQVGIKDEAENFEFTQDFKNCNIDINNLSESNLENLKLYAKENATPAFTKMTNTEGNFDLYNLTLGVYLFVQENETENYTMQTMLVTVPELTTQNGLQYDVTVKPKIINKEIFDANNLANSSKTELVKDKLLPYTGILSWPVPVLVIVGIVIFCIAWLKVYSNSKKKVK